MDPTAVAIAFIALVGTLGAAWINTRSKSLRELTEPEAIVVGLTEQNRLLRAERDRARSDLDDCRKQLVKQP